MPLPRRTVVSIIIVILIGLAWAVASPAAAEVVGRYVRIEAPASVGMGIHEVEVWANGRNIALRNTRIKFAGVGHRGGDINDRPRGPALVDGAADFQQRSQEFTTAGDTNPWIEMDFGVDEPFHRVVIKSAIKPVYGDRAVRLVSVLNAQRRVVWIKAFSVLRKPFDSGEAGWELTSETGELIGRELPVNTARWARMGDLIEARSAPVPPDAQARAERFAQRNSPEAIARLAEQFFARVDLSRPDLATVKHRLDQGDFAGALDGYRDHFVDKMRRTIFRHEIHEGAPPRAATVGVMLDAEDMARGIAIMGSSTGVVAQRLDPGAIDWAAQPDDARGDVGLERRLTRVGILQSPLLLAYRATGLPEYLAQWTAITDDWGMNILSDLARSKVDRRYYFVKDGIQEFNGLAELLSLTAGDQPDFAKALSGATLARLLMPVLEEYLPAYWWVCRRASFNHTYNALNAATITSRVLDDFHAGQRLDYENRRHWQKIWTSNMTRDGAMNEFSDEGHMFMQWRMVEFVMQMSNTPPWWWTPDFLSEFQTGWRLTTALPLRHLSPMGFGHRYGSRNYDYFPRLWWLVNPKITVLELPGVDTLDFHDLMRQPERACIMQTVFGAGRDRATLSPARQTAWDLVTGYYGQHQTPPATISDWMPYAGAWEMRRSWEPDASYIHMVCQPKGHPSTNGSVWNTEFSYFDFGQPIVACGPVWIDGQPPFNEAGTLTYKPGSKTESLAVASEFPIPSRWHTSALCDYAEASYEGVYQTHRAEYGIEWSHLKPLLGDSPVIGARADRRLILFRPARLVIVTDSARAPETDKQRRYDIRQRFATPEKRDRNDTPPRGTFQGDAAALTYVNERMPAVKIHRFTTAELSWDPRTTPDAWDRGSAMSNHIGVIEELGGILSARTRGDLLMAALIEPQPTLGNTRIKHVVNLSTRDATGFTATLDDDSTLTWLATAGAPGPLHVGQLRLHGDGLLLHRIGDECAGLVLGATALSIDGKDIALTNADFEFSCRGSTLIVEHIIHRPIEPVTYSPQVTVFTGTQQVTLTSATPGVHIRYTLDGTEPTLASPQYTGPLTIQADTYIRARAVRPGAKAIPFSTAGTQVTAISDARYYRRDLNPAQMSAAALSPGLQWELVESATWFALFSHLHLPAVLPATVRGQTNQLLDVSMRQGDGPFGVRYDGWIEIPADGVWTFHPPAEYVGATCEPGYDLRLWIDGQEWDPGQRFHGRNLWSVPLAKGLHRLLVTFADARHRDGTVKQSGLWANYPNPWVVWKGQSPVIAISGPGFEPRAIPREWLRH